MTRRCAGNGLLLAGLIVTLVGLGVALTASLGIPRYWTTVGVGVALLVAGAARRALGTRGES
jgi:hypothetical protein